MSHKPKTYHQAQPHLQWWHAMESEINALLQNNTWKLVPRLPNINIMGNKWLFRIKRKTNGDIDRYKACLVAKGFSQQHGIDYNETFSPVVKATIIHSVLSLALISKWQI